MYSQYSVLFNTASNTFFHVHIKYNIKYLPYKGAPLVESDLCGKPMLYDANLVNK